MLIKLTDFAEQNRITDRTVQKHIKENEKILEGHVERRGKQGTWLDDFAVAFLKDKIQLPTKDEVLVPTAREASLLVQLAETNARWAAAEKRAAENAEAAGQIKLLEAQSISLKDSNIELQRKVIELEANQKIMIDELDQKHQMEKKDLEKEIQELKKARDDQKSKSELAIEDLRRQLDEEKKKTWIQKLMGR